MTVSKIVSDADISKMKAAVLEYQGLIKEIELYNKAGIKMDYTTADIEKKISDLQLAIDVFEGKR